MSLKTWFKEFYPTPASKPDCSPAEHSLRKWIGFLPRNLKKHGCRHNRIWLKCGQIGHIMLCDYKCALCIEHLDSGCKTCPLFKAGFGCLKGESIYHDVITGKKPVEFMVSALRKAVKIEKLERNKGNKTK